MKIFIFEGVGNLTYRYHSGGGLVVIAKDTDHVKELTKDYGGLELSSEEWEDCLIYDIQDTAQPQVFVFPDAGCC